MTQKSAISLSRRVATRDRDVRSAVMKKVLSDHISDPRVLVMEELGLEHGTCRVDIAVINGLIHGYELKSDSDTLARLPQQAVVYSRALDKVTLVVGEKHELQARGLIPSWWGIKITYAGQRGAINIDNFRPALINPNVSPYHVSHLLWRNEAIAILESLNVGKKDLRCSRFHLYALLAEMLPLRLLRKHVREALKNRTNWRRLVQPL